MSEEQIQEEQVTEEDTKQVAEQPPQASPLFKALYEAAEEPDAPEPAPVPEEPEVQPATLNEALDGLGEEEEVVQEVVQEEQQDPEPEAIKTEEPEKAQPKKKKVKQVIDPDVPEQPNVEPAFSTPEVDPDEEYMETLLPEEKEIYKIAKYASQNMDEYRGADEDFKNYFTKSKAYIEKRLKEDPHVDLREDQEYKNFMAQNRPRFNHTDIKKVEKEMIIAEAERRADQKNSVENRRLKHELERIKKEPIVQQAKQNIRKATVNIIPEEYREKISTQEGLEQLAKENPFEYQIMDNVASYLAEVSDTFVEITTGVTEYNPNNQMHTRLKEWVEQEQDAFINGGQTQKDGKVFMRRERYHTLPEDKRAQYYTWSDNDLLTILMARAQQRLEGDLQAHRQAIENAGYVRNGAPQVQSQPAPAPKQEPPRATSAPRPGGVPAQKTPPKGNAILNVLGL